MAELINNATQERIYLTKYHVFGRKQKIVNTHIDNPRISRVHMLIEWTNGQWVVHNKSRNGVWLNGKLLDAEQHYLLCNGDKISLTSDASVTFIVHQITPPQDALVQCNEHPAMQSAKDDALPYIIPLKQVNLLPDENSPEIILYYHTDKQTWMCENAMSMDSNPVQEGDIIRFANKDWTFFTSSYQNDNETLVSEISESDELKYVFHISQDEEHANLRIKHNETEIDMDVRSHHYLTALLARHKKQTSQLEMENDMQEGGFQGWMSIKKLSKDLGLSESHINIQIHRARKQIVEQFQRFGLIAPDIIERRRGYARFASDNFSIFKGNQLEN